MPNQPIKSLKDVIDFNNKHPEIYKGQNQEYLKVAQMTSGLDDPMYLDNLKQNQDDARRLIKHLLKEHCLDALITPSHPDLYSQFPAAVAGYPILTLPIGITEHGDPFGLSIYSDWGKEHVLYSIAHHMDPTSSARQPPHFLNS
ncbi:hypothetical protein DSO57_1033765 [Entomophthora muscae]|uniref:Uncharacterized protein n=1 Tax=Entomophthora muscae TaxID=34485 RepID=A0ACC2T062_9FUNG|nr:hypothetical protein DSO57_1033765 [Entomophthora muscae]